MFESANGHFSKCFPCFGKYAVNGNHEYYVGVGIAEKFCQEAGFTLLSNERVDIPGAVIVRDETDIYPVEVEECFNQHPDVSEVQVFGVPHAKKGQEVIVWVKLRENAQLNERDLVAFADAQVPEGMRQRYYKIVNGFPMTRSGKVRKFMLCEMAEKELGTEIS